MTYIRATVGVVALVLAGAAGVFFAGSTRASAVDDAREMAVDCGEAQRAVVRQMPRGGSTLVSVDCVGAGSPRASMQFSDRAVAPFAPSQASYAMPVAYVPQVQDVAPARQTRPALSRTVLSQAPVRRVVKRAPSWQKRALVVGGSAGAGAGIGALIGGKKGALIGAAAGGGGAAIVDLVRNR